MGANVGGLFAGVLPERVRAFVNVEGFGLSDADTADAPWTVIKSDDKKRARLNCMQHFLCQLEYPDKDQRVLHGPDPLIVGSPALVIEKDRHLWG